MKGYIEIVRLLLDHEGTDINVEDQNGYFKYL